MNELTVIAPSERALILAHYERAAALIAANFPKMPIVCVCYPNGLDEKPSYYASLTADDDVPPGICTAEVDGAAGPRRFFAAETRTLQWLAQGGAVDFESWTPSARDPESVGFARILLAPHGGADAEHVALAMLALRTVLFGHGVEAIPVFDGLAGATLFIPFADAPAYEPVRRWLHGVADTAVARNTKLLTTNVHDHDSQLVHVNVSSNAVGRYSSLPYSIIGGPHLGMVTPIAWNELGIVRNGQYTAANSAARLDQGDIFERLARELHSQRFADAARS